MELNNNLVVKIKEMPDEYANVALKLLEELEKGRKSRSQIEEMLLQEVREIMVLKGDSNEVN